MRRQFRFNPSYDFSFQAEDDQKSDLCFGYAKLVCKDLHVIRLNYAQDVVFKTMIAS